MPRIQIDSNNYSGQSGLITFYSINNPSTPVDLGVQNIPYIRIGDDIYGQYNIYLVNYGQTCSVTAIDPLPSAPTGLSLTPGNSQLLALWGTPARSGTAPITEYILQYSEDDGANWNTFDGGLSAPTGLTAVPGDGSLSLNWFAPSGAVSDYLVEITPSGGSANSVFVGSNATSYITNNLTNGLLHSVRVAAINYTRGTWSNTVSGTPFFVPVPTISGLQLWLDASDASTLYDATSGGSLVVADGGVARWEDKSGNVRHMTQGTAGSRPLRKTAIQGGKDVLRFDGSDDSLSVPNSTETFKFLHSTDSTVFVVFQRPTAGNYRPVLNTYDTSSVNIGFALYVANGSEINDRVVALIANGINSSEVSNNNSGNGFLSDGFSVLSVISKPTNGTVSTRSSLRSNGGPAATNNTNTGTISTSNSTYGLTICRDQYAPSQTFTGTDIAEIIIYNTALSDTDRTAIESYLMAKWGIEIPQPVQVQYLVVAGGGGGGTNGGGGGGAGGYRSSVAGESSGGGSVAEAIFYPTSGTTYTVTVGAGGVGSTSLNRGSDGSSSVFGSLSSVGGGGGFSHPNTASTGGDGGSGGGGAYSAPGGSGTVGQGYGGGTGGTGANGGGGGGAGEAGISTGTAAGGNGGAGLLSSVDGNSTFRAGGGGGGNHENSVVGSGGTGGGGNAGPYNSSSPGSTGSPNTGGGGGGGSGRSGSVGSNGGDGGSGVVILRCSAAASSTTGSPTVTVVGQDTIYTFTGTGSITF
jgi:hypothetical protein